MSMSAFYLPCLYAVYVCLLLRTVTLKLGFYKNKKLSLVDSVQGFREASSTYLVARYGRGGNYIFDNKYFIPPPLTEPATALRYARHVVSDRVGSL